MSRFFPNTILPIAVAQKAAQPVQFIRLGFGSGAVYLTTAAQDITWNSVTWTAIGGLLDVGNVTESPDDQSTRYTMRLSGVNQTILSILLQDQFIGRPVEIWFGWIAQGTNFISNSSAETDLTLTLASGSSTLTRDLTKFWDGIASFKIVTANVDGSGVIFLGTGTSSRIPNIVDGQPYTFRTRIYLPEGTVASTVSLNIGWFCYSGAGTFLGSIVSPITFGLSASGWQEAAFTSVGLAGTNFVIPFILTNGAQGVFTFYTDGVQYGPGDPLFQPTDGVIIIGGTVIVNPILAFSGYMNGGFEVEEGPDRAGGEVIITLRCASRLAMLQQQRGLRTNLESHGRVYPNDKFFEFVSSIASKRILWGGLGGIARVLAGERFHPPTSAGGGVWRRGA